MILFVGRTWKRGHLGFWSVEPSIYKAGIFAGYDLSLFSVIWTHPRNMYFSNLTDFEVNCCIFLCNTGKIWSGMDSYCLTLFEWISEGPLRGIVLTIKYWWIIFSIWIHFSSLFSICFSSRRTVTRRKKSLPTWRNFRKSPFCGIVRTRYAIISSIFWR